MVKFKIVKVEKNIRQTGELSFEVRMMKSGFVVEKTFDTLPEARAYRDGQNYAASLDKVESSIFESRINKAQGKDFTFSKAIKKYRKEKTAHKKGWDSEGTRLDRLLRLPAADMPLYMIHRPQLLNLLKDIRDGIGQQVKGVKQHKVSDATVKRYYNLIRHIFQTAVDEWKKIDKNPFDELASSERPKGGKARDRRLQGNEYSQLLDKLQGEAKAIMVLCVETAMRKGEVMSLEWQNIDFKKRTAKLFDTKNGEDRVVPLSSTAVAMLESLKKKDEDEKVVTLQRGKVFSIGEMAFRYQWRKAREAINAPDLRIHDLRHEATSQLFEKGLNVLEAAAVTGHKSLSMLKRYTHLNPTDIAKKLG